MPTIRDFRDLRVYRAAYEGAMLVFAASKRFPEDERFGLTSQARRSSRSVAANIAEAWRKRRYPAAFVAKLSDADAEVAETRAHLDFALGFGYLDPRAYRRLDDHYERLTRQLVRMMSNPDRWTPGRASGRAAGAARVSPGPPRPRAGKPKADVSPDPTGAREPAPVRSEEVRSRGAARKGPSE
ncbi:MAG TPA: four helix bundle protein [Longimicrobiales bacterium]|nr:four helix bundle protein [Longimicrobiales bacterium]